MVSQLHRLRATRSTRIAIPTEFHTTRRQAHDRLTSTRIFSTRTPTATTSVPKKISAVYNWFRTIKQSMSLLNFGYTNVSYMFFSPVVQSTPFLTIDPPASIMTQAAKFTKKAFFTLDPPARILTIDPPAYFTPIDPSNGSVADYIIPTVMISLDYIVPVAIATVDYFSNRK